MRPKNVLIILCDQMRKDALGCYGNANVHTPHLDGLAQSGQVFERCYVANPICSPNRMSIFTGMYPRNHGVWTNGLAYQDNTAYTLPHHLSRRGYRTASIGKIHFSPTDCDTPDVTTPESRYIWDDTRADYSFTGPYGGFEYVELSIGHQRQRGHYRQWFLERGGTDDLFDLTHATDDPMSGSMHIPSRLHVSSFVGERTCAFLRGQRGSDAPFFVVASFPDPHHPFDPPKETETRRARAPVRLPIGTPEDIKNRPRHYAQHLDGAWNRYGLTPPKHPGGLPADWRDDRIAKTDAMVELIDDNVGRILDVLREEALLEDTLILFTSDHGELLGDHGLWLKGPFFYEGLINVPLIVTGKGIAPSRSADLVSSVDLAPMMLSLLGLDPLPFADGIAPALEDGRIVGGRRRCLIEYRTGYLPDDTASFALVDKRYKYVRHQTGEEELTDLVTDPQERVNRNGPEDETLRRQMALLLLDEIISTGKKAPAQVGHA